MVDDKARTRARALLAVSAILLTWSVVVAISGGFRLELWGLRISSRNALRIFLIGAVPAVIAWRLAYVERLEALARAGASADTQPRAGDRMGDRGWCARHRRALRQPRRGRLGSVRIRQRSRRSGRAARRASTSATRRTCPGPMPGTRWCRSAIASAQAARWCPTYAPGLPLLMALARFVREMRAVPRHARLRGDARALHLPLGPASLRHEHRTRRSRARRVLPGDALHVAHADGRPAGRSVLDRSAGVRHSRNHGSHCRRGAFHRHRRRDPSQPGAVGRVPLADGGRALSDPGRRCPADGALRRGKHLGAAPRRVDQQRAVRIGAQLRVRRSRAGVLASPTPSRT